MRDITIILDSNDLRFDYHPSEIIKFRRMWNEYRKHTDNRMEIIKQLADDLKTTPDNITLLALDQIRKRKIR